MKDNKDPFFNESLNYFSIKKSEFNKEKLEELYRKYIENTDEKVRYNLSLTKDVQMYNYYNVINYQILKFFWDMDNVDRKKLQSIEKKVNKFIYK